MKLRHDQHPRLQAVLALTQAPLFFPPHRLVGPCLDRIRDEAAAAEFPAVA